MQFEKKKLNSEIIKQQKKNSVSRVIVVVYQIVCALTF